MMRREWRLPALGGLAVLLLPIAGHQLLGGIDAPLAPPPVSLPPPAPPSADAPVPPPVSAASPEGLRLHGVTGAGAIISGADGRQRLVTIGRDVLPGLTLAQVRVDHALLRSVAGDIRLDFTGASSSDSAAPPVPTASAERDDTLRYRLGLAPHRVDGRVVGHQVRSGAALPALTAAGVRPGDLILSVNGSRLDEERVAELAWTLANSDRVELEIERGGRPLRLSSSR